jgi:hypothetical protein
VRLFRACSFIVLLGSVVVPVEPAPAQSQACPLNAHVDRVTQEGNVRTTHCKCDDGFRSESGTCAPTAGERLPSVDPAFFITDEERSGLCERIAGVKKKQALFQAQLDKLAAVQGTLAQASDVYEVRAELLQDLGTDSLDVGAAVVQVALTDGIISTDAAKARAATSLALIKSAKFGVNALAAADAPAQSKRQYTKAIDALFTLKDLVPISPPIGTAEQWKAFMQTGNTLPKLVQISERHVEVRGDRATWSLYLKDFDDALGAGGKLLPALQAVRSSAHVIDGLAALWLVRNDKDVVDQAFVKTQTARRYYEQRMGELEQLAAFYNERLNRMGGLCP